MRLTPTIRLTTWYVLIIMCISIFFSVVLYRATTDQAATALRNQMTLFQERRPPPFMDEYGPSLQELLQAQLSEIQTRARLALLITNSIVLIVAGSLSYLLARRTLRPIEKNLEAQRQFTADASHELRTPLTAIRTEIEVALRGQELNQEESKRIMQSTLEEVSRLEHLSHGLLRLAQSETSGHDLLMSPVLNAELIDLARRKVQPLAEKKNIEISYGTVDGAVQVDKESIIELLVILLDNAIKYSPEKSKIAISANTTNKSALIQVKDQGVGIKASELVHIFDRFYRADTSRSKNRVDGYGLGLPIAKQIVERHHGKIAVASTLGEGSTFTVTLPQARG
jgi:two-component system, OmpR family, sensor histidine kinase CiaH